MVSMDYKSSGISYGLWCLGLLGLCGIHRFYNGKWGTGILWLLTGGLFFIGQLVDLFLIPGMVDRENARRRDVLRREGHL